MVRQDYIRLTPDCAGQVQQVGELANDRSLL